MNCSLCFFAFLPWIKFCSYSFRQVFFYFGVKKVVAGRVKKQRYDGNLLGRRIGRFTEVVVWIGFTVMLKVNWVQMFNKCIIFHGSTKSLVPPLHKFTNRKLDLFLFPFFGKLNLINIAVYLLYWLINNLWEWKKNCPKGK